MNPPFSDDIPVLSPERLVIFRRAASLLTSSLEIEHALAHTIGVCLPVLGDFGFFDVVLDDGVRRTARAHADPALEAMLNATTWEPQERTDINLCALSSGAAVLHENTDDAWYAHAFGEAPRYFAFQSMLSVPVQYGDELIGSLTLFMSTSGRHHTADDVNFAAELASIAAPVVANARLLERERRAQAALKYSEERLRLATDAANIGIWDWDIANDKITWSERVYEMHALAPGQFGGRVKDFTELVHPDDRAIAHEKIQAALRDGDIYSHQFRALRPDGSIRWLSTWAHVERDATGTAVRMFGSSLDITAQKNTEAGLSSLNAQLKERVVSSTSERDRIWGMSQDILAVASLSGYFISVSPAFKTILGWGEHEVLSTPFLKFAHPNQRNTLMLRLTDLQQGQPLHNLEIRAQHKDGSYRWLSWTIVPEGQLLYGVGRDITELKRQREYLLNATERRLQLALNVGGMGAWQWDMQSDSVIWWPGMERVHGLAPGTTMDAVDNYLEFVHPEDRERVTRSFEYSEYVDSSSNIEYRVIWPDGSIHWLEGRGEVFFDAEGNPKQRAGICVDITARKLTEQNLRFLARVSAELTELVDHEQTLEQVARLAIPEFADWCTVDMVDEQGELKRVAVAHVDPQKVQLAYDLHAKYPPTPEMPHGVWQVIRSCEAELVAEITDQMLVDTIDDPVYLDSIRALGFSSYIGAPLAVRGKILGVLTFISTDGRRTYTREDVALAVDIGRRAAIAIENSMLYRTLKETDRRKDDFLAMLAHELRNPLAPIQVAADLLTMPLDAESLQKTGEIISRQVAHMTGLVDDLLDVSRVTQGHVVIEHKPVDVTHLINAAIEQVRPLIERYCHRLSVTTGTGSLYVEGDEKRLIQVVANLLNNAAKYTPEGGEISLRVEALNDFIDISVTDNGIGMSPDLIASAFELFVQGQRAADRAEGGLGLGLALVKSLVELHRGSVRAYSKGANSGSKFIVTLPRLALPAQQPDKPKKMLRPETERPLRILMVDDNVDAAQMLMLFLQMLKHEAHVVYTPQDALAEIQRNVYDVLLLDIGLPDMDGNELARRVRAALKHRTPVLIAISGYGREQDRDIARAAGIDHYIVKPVDTGELLQLLNQIPRADF